MQAFFWISLATLFYTYIGYGLLLLLLNAIRRPVKKLDEDFLPAVCFVVPAFNEEAVLEKKIQNSLALNYPQNRISYVFVTDGSTDSSPFIVQQHPQLQLLHQPVRRGKTAALNRAMQAVRAPIVVFSDANTFLHPDSIRKLVRHYVDESIGGVSGEKRVANQTPSAVGFGERLYWRYESLLKKTNADFYTIVGAAGELFSIRTHLYQPVEENVILDDFVISARVCLQGYRFLYDEEAFGVESSSTSIEEERKRKIRISAGCYQAFTLLKGLLNPFRNGRLAFQYVSHRVLRWVLCPLLLPLLAVCNALLVLNNAGWIYEVVFWAQLTLYVIAAVGGMAAGKKSVAGIFLVPYYFLFMILSQYAGFFRFVRKGQTVLWEKAHREPAAPVG